VKIVEREQTRGLFALGVVAAILVYKDTLASFTILGGTKLGNIILESIVGCWGAYAFLMAVGIYNMPSLALGTACLKDTTQS
jgi:hypothetical protein